MSSCATPRWLAFLGDRGYELALWMNNPLNFVRRRFGLGYWSLSAHLKQRVKTAVNFIGEFEKSLSDEARRNKVDGVICGHIHHAASRDIDGVHYLNTGDWVESCTAIGENADGSFELIRWHDVVTRARAGNRRQTGRSASGRVMRILVATDAWHPQVNGVVRTYERLAVELAALGVEMTVLAPHEFHTVACPTYPEIRLALPGLSRMARRFRALKPDAVHIATEGPLGWMARRHCRRHGIRFTTSFHTRFPEYLNQRFAIPTGWTVAALRRFHNAGAGLMVATPSLARELEADGFERVLPWTRGVDTALFRPSPVRLFGDGPVFLYVGRIAAEKNIAAFLDLDLPGRKVVVGGGPQLDELSARYPDVLFTGKKTGEALAECYASADAFVFPSTTDTFGMVLLEAMASGLPIAALPVCGPQDVVTDGVTGFLSHDLRAAALAALDARSVPRARQSGRVQLGECGATVPRQHHRRLPQRPGAGSIGAQAAAGEDLAAAASAHLRITFFRQAVRRGAWRGA